MAATYDAITVLGCAGKIAATTFNTSTADNTMASEALPSALLNVIGRNLRVRAWGYYSTDAVTPGTIRVRLKMGGVTVLDATSATLTVAQTNKGWHFHADVTTVTTGATGTVFAHGLFEYHTGTLDVPNAFGLVNTAAVASVNLTGVVTPTLTFTRSVSDADNGNTCAIFLCDVGGLV